MDAMLELFRDKINFQRIMIQRITDNKSNYYGSCTFTSQYDYSEKETRMISSRFLFYMT